MLIAESTVHLSYNVLFVLGTIAVVIIDSVVGGINGISTWGSI